MDSDNQLFGTVDGYADGEEPIVFYTKRHEYRRYEPEEYRKLASGETKPARGFFKVLVGTRANRMIFMAMIMTVAVVLVVSFFGKKGNQCVVDNVSCAMTAFSWGDDVYLTIEMEKYGKEKFGPKVLNFTMVAEDSEGADSQVCVDSFVFDSEKKDQILRSSFRNYDIIKIKANISCGHVSKDIFCKVESK